MIYEDIHVELMSTETLFTVSDSTGKSILGQKPSLYVTHASDKQRVS